MIKLSESRLREIIAEELDVIQGQEYDTHTVDDDTVIDPERAGRIDKLSREIDEKMLELEKEVARRGLDENIFDIGSSVIDTAKAVGSLGSGIAGRFTRNSSITKAIQQYAKESLIRWIFGKMGLQPGVPKELLISFFEELEFHEIQQFIAKPQCKVFVEQMYDTLLDFGLDSLRPTIDSATSKISAIPLLGVIMKAAPGNDIMTKLLSGVGTEALQNFIRTDPEIKTWINDNVLVGICDVWDNVWDNVDVEDGLIDLNAALDKAYPEEHISDVNKLIS